MYIIEEGKAYLVEGEVGYLVNFDTTGKMLIDKEQTIDVLGKVTYSFEEIYAKLNIAYMIEEAKRKVTMNNMRSEIIEELNKLTADNEELVKENEELKIKNEELVKENEELKQQLTVKFENEKENASENKVVEEETKVENVEENQSPETETTETENEVVQEETKVETNVKRKK